MKRDLYAEVSARIVAELEAGAAPWVKPWSATPGANIACNAVSNRPYSGCNVVLLWMAQAAGYRTPRFLWSWGGNVRKGERGSKIYFVKQLQVHDRGAEDETATRLVPMMREYTASIAHEVNQPLAAVVANAEACLRWLDRETPNMGRSAPLGGMGHRRWQSGG
jgi:antirestriction protein ArdC